MVASYTSSRAYDKSNFIVLQNIAPAPAPSPAFILETPARALSPAFILETPAHASSPAFILETLVLAFITSWTHIANNVATYRLMLQRILRYKGYFYVIRDTSDVTKWYTCYGYLKFNQNISLLFAESL